MNQGTKIAEVNQDISKRKMDRQVEMSREANLLEGEGALPVVPGAISPVNAEDPVNTEDPRNKKKQVAEQQSLNRCLKVVATLRKNSWVVSQHVWFQQHTQIPGMLTAVHPNT